jgi:aminopeptidase N
MRSRDIIASVIVTLMLAQAVPSQQPKPESFRARDVVLDLAVDFPDQQLSGSITYNLENWTKAPASRVSFILNRLMEVSAVSDGARLPLRFTQDVVRFRDTPLRQVDQVVVDLAKPVPPGGHTTIRLDYAGNLVGYTEIGWLYVKDRIDTAFTILREDALAFPRIDGIVDSANRRRPAVDFTYRGSVRVPSNFVVAAGGKQSRVINGDGTTTWTYASSGPSPFVNIAIAPFDTVSERGVRIFYFRTDSLGAQRLMRSTQRALTLLTNWFGPLHSPPNLSITEIPDGWGSQASLVGGIIQTAVAFRDSTRMGELYHELSHLWNANDLDNPSPRWNEGLAMFVEDLLRERVDAWQKRTESEADDIARVKRIVARDSSLRRVPMIDYGRIGNTGRSYSVGGLMFATLFDVVGEAEFDRIIGGYYQRFGSGGTTRDFISFANQTSSRDLTRFFDDWLLSTRWVDLLANSSTISDLAAPYAKSGTK